MHMIHMECTIKSKQELEDYIKQLKVAQAEKEGQKRDIYVKQLERTSKIKPLNKELASWNDIKMQLIKENLILLLIMSN